MTGALEDARLITGDRAGFMRAYGRHGVEGVLRGPRDEIISTRRLDERGAARRGERRRRVNIDRDGVTGDCGVHHGKCRSRRARRRRRSAAAFKQRCRGDKRKSVRAELAARGLV